MRTGFSLVELSIVLVILGLLTGGILAGQSLIRASELRSVTTEYNRYITATQTFRDKYFAIPGDFREATKFWGLQVSGSGCVSNSGIAATSTPGACDGNGNGTIEAAGAVSQAGEFVQFWRHLATAGLIEGTYSGLAGAGGTNHCVANTNCPSSKLNSAGWGIRGFTTYYSGNLSDWAGDYGNFFDFGAFGTTTTPQGNSVLKPEEAWNIDTKIDDGKPGIGKVLGFTLSACTVATGATNFTADYRLNDNGNVCALHFLRAF